MSIKNYNIAGPEWKEQNLFARQLVNPISADAVVNIYLPHGADLAKTPSRLLVTDDQMILEPVPSPKDDTRILAISIAAIGKTEEEPAVDNFMFAQDRCTLVKHWLSERPVLAGDDNTRQHCLVIIIKVLTGEARIAFFFSAGSMRHILMLSDTEGIKTLHYDSQAIGHRFVYERALEEVHDWVAFRDNSVDELVEPAKKLRLSHASHLIQRLLGRKPENLFVSNESGEY